MEFSAKLLEVCRTIKEVPQNMRAAVIRGAALSELGLHIGDLVQGQMLILPKELGPKKNYQICAAEVREELGGEEAGKLEICIFARAVSGQSDVIVRLGVVDGKDIR